MIECDMSKILFYPYKAILFLKFLDSPCDIFVQLSQTNYVKILAAGDRIEKEFVEKYIRRKVYDFYITQSAKEKFHIELSSLTNKDLDKIFAREILGGILQEIGVSEEVLSKVNDLADKVENFLKNDKSLSKLVSEITQSDDQFQYEHSYLTCALATQIARGMDWHNVQIEEKICMASFFHDLNVEAIQLKDIELEQDLNQLQERLLRVHPRQMASVLRANPNISSEVINIVEKHHEETLENLPPYCICFNLAHKLVMGMYRQHFDNSKISQIISVLKSKYPSEKLLRYFYELEKIIKTH